MKNREKYPNTDDALKAFEKHNKVCDCGCSFEEWLDKEDPSLPNMAIAGVLLDLLFGIVGAQDKPANKENKEPSNDDKLADVECPICHGKNGKVKAGVFTPFFICPDCGSFVGVNEDYSKKHRDLKSSVETFKSFIADLCTKNLKKD